MDDTDLGLRIGELLEEALAARRLAGASTEPGVIARIAQDAVAAWEGSKAAAVGGQ